MTAPDEGLRDSAVFNLTDAVTMVIDDSPFGLELTCAALKGFGITPKFVCHDAARAIEILSDQMVDLIVVDCEMPGMDGHEFVRWLRHSGLDPNAYAPVVMTAAHVRGSKVNAVRDCGANFLVTKPFSAAGLLERVLWVARDERPFLEVGDYKGPDRRHNEAKPRSHNERRADMIARIAFEAEQKKQAAEAAPSEEAA